MMRALAREARADLSLAARLHARIAENGPLTVEAFMQACLSDAASGAYTSRQPIGGAGDFITAPEISQMFGELIGLWAVTVWQSMVAPRAVTVAELGPGRGTSMADALRAWRAVPTFLDAVSVALVETSPVMVAAQRSALREARVPVSWYATLDELPDGPLIVLANEFIDVLPIRQFIYRDGTWRERMVASDRSGGFCFTEGDRLGLGDQAGDLPDSAPDSSILETRPAARTLLHELARRASVAPLAVLIIDYGHDKAGFGDTLQAVRSHRFAATLADPGSADLSAHVDFADLKRQASALGLKPYGPVPQGEFLLKLGLGERRDRLLQGATPAQAEAIASGASRLVDPKQMGILFKALVLTGTHLPPPPPFGPQHLTVSY